MSRDLDDDALLALAIAARPDVIVSDDRDLLILAVHAGVPIVTPANAFARLSGQLHKPSAVPQGNVQTQSSWRLMLMAVAETLG